MARTFVPGIKLALDKLRKYIAKYQNQLQENMWPFLWALIELALDIVEIALVVLAAQTPAGEAYDPDVVLPTSGYINQVRGAVDKFFASVGAIEGA